MTEAKHQHIDVHEVGSATVAVFRDSKILDPTTIEEMGQELIHLIADEGRHHLVLSFRGVLFFASAAIGRLITVHSAIKQVNGSLKLCDMDEGIRQAFAVARLDTFFDVYNRQADALTDREASGPP